MVKRLMIGLFALSLAAIWLSEANAYSIRRRRSVGVTVIGGQAGDAFVTDIFGLPDDGNLGCGLIRGDVYCLNNNAADPFACDKSTGYSAALVLVTDLDFIKPKTKPYRWTDWELNSDIADFGQRRQLRVMEQLSLSNDPTVFTITLPVKTTVNKAGIHAISGDVVTYWKNVTGASNSNEALRSYVGEPDVNGILIPADGFGTNTDQYLQNLPGDGMIPIFGDKLKELEGQVVCFVSHVDQVAGDDLHGKYRGTFAAKVLTIATDNSSVTMEVMDSDDVCNQTLYNDYTTDPQPETPVAGCKRDEKLVFAPAPCDYVTYTDDAFPAESGTIDCSTGVCKDSVEVELDDTFGQNLCPQNTTFKKFIPKDFGGDGPYADYAFIGTVESDNSTLSEQVICGEGSGGVQGVEYSRYECVPLENVLEPAVIPDCCGCSGWVQEP